MLNIFNTLSGKKEPFHPFQAGNVSMYVCGVTVYDLSHLGHARSALVFDVIRAYLEFKGMTVTYVRNFTDIDDKIINRALQEGKSARDIVQTYLTAYQEDMRRLGVRPATIEPRATEHMPDIVALIRRLVQQHHAYQVDGDVFFSVTSFPQYGSLSKRKAEDLLAGARVEVDTRKQNPMDFALWKSSKPGEPSWESPWGPGRPGWHIECSAMSMCHLGEQFDIHGGGMDLIFPHHENEIAQSRAATGRKFAKYWIHNGFVQINKEKMSKSLGNFFTIRDVFHKWPLPTSPAREEVTGEVLRYFFLATHYRGPLDFSDQGLLEAKRALDGFYDLFQRLDEVVSITGQADGELLEAIERLKSGFSEAMDDDFNTPAAIAKFQSFKGETNRLFNRGLSKDVCARIRKTFKDFGQVLRIFQLDYRDWEFAPSAGFFPGPPPLMIGVPPRTLSDKEIQERVDERLGAKKRKDFKRADEIRTELKSLGITIEDKPDGTTRWKR